MIPPQWFTEIAHIQPVVDAIMRIPFTMIFEEGEVYATFDDIKSPRFQKSMTRKLKGFVSIEPFSGDHSLIAGPRIAYAYYEHSSRRKAYRKRMTMKAMFPKHRGMLLSARQISQKDFLSKTNLTPDIQRALKHNGFKSLKHLWQVCNNKNLKVPQPQKSLTHFMR